MPSAHRKGDIGSGHGCHFPPTPATGGSPDVNINGRAAMRVGDSYAPHACVAGHAPPHARAMSQGSPTVFINGKPAGRRGDGIDCGGVAQSGSGDVFIDDRGVDLAKFVGGTGAGGTGCQVTQASQASPAMRG